MRTRISKHGKYRIYEGVEREVGDMLQSGDQLTLNFFNGKRVTVEVIQLIRDREEWENVIPQVGLASFFLFDTLLSQRGDGVFDRNNYLIRNGKTVSVWFPFLDDSPVKIKRRIPRSETGITGDTVREDTK